MTVPVSTRRYTSCCPPYPRGYISCVLLGGGRIKLIYKIHIILLLVRYCLRFFKLLCLFLQKDSIRWVYLVKVVRENSSFWCLFFKLCCCCLVAQSCPTLCGPMDCGPPGSSVHGFSRQEYWSRLSFPTSGDLLLPGIKPVSLASPGLAGGLFISRAAWELQQTCIADIYRYIDFSLLHNNYVEYLLLATVWRWWEETETTSTKYVAQGHTASKGWSCSCNPGLSNAVSMLSLKSPYVAFWDRMEGDEINSK